MAITDIIKYFKQCYKADNASSVFLNIFSKNIENKVFIPTEHLANAKKDYLLFNSAKITKIFEKAYIYRKEKSLIYCTMFVSGKTTNEEGKIQKICAPLFFYPASLEEKDQKPKKIYKLAVERKNIEINTGLINSLLNDKEKSDSVANKIITRIYESEYVLFKEDILYFSDLLAENGIKIENKLAELYPVLSTEATVKRLYEKDRKNYYEIINSSAVIIIKKPKSMRGVIDELDSLSDTIDHSTPLKMIFGKKQISLPKLKPESHYLPAELSNSQKKIIDSAANNPITVVVGPPGTGKSFTIASIAIDHFNRGEKVLITSRMNHAVDVIADKLEQLSGTNEMFVRGGDKNYLYELKKYIQNLLNSIMPDIKDKNYLEMEIDNTKKEIFSVKKNTFFLDHKYNSLVKKEIKLSQFFNNWERGLIKQNFWSKRKHRKKHNYAVNKPFLYKIMSLIEENIWYKKSLIQNIIQITSKLNILYVFEKHRKDIISFNRAIRTRSDYNQQKIFGKMNFDSIMKLFPVWLVNNQGIYNVLPFEKEIFDVAIIDEATQCDIASCIPILQRAKRIVIVGDPHQLRHVSFLPKSDMTNFAHKNGIKDDIIEDYDYREKSILDFVLNMKLKKKGIFFLDEHYRSLAPIIRFSNKEFYNNSLKLMTESPLNQKASISAISCNGVRSKSNTNQAELDDIVSYLVTIFKSQKNFVKESCQSIGIVTPFRQQADFIYKRLLNLFTIKQLEKHDVLVGTAHSFQGEERDVVLLSLCADDNTHINTFRFMSKPDVLNVSITRARGSQIVYYSFDEKKLGEDILVRKYIEYIKSFDSPLKEKDKSKDHFQDDVIDFLEKHNVKTYPDYEIGGLKIDIVVEYRKTIYGVDLIGYPGRLQESFPIERYKMYNRAGLEILPIEYSKWVLYKSSCTERILKHINYDFTREANAHRPRR